jgi:hypothetical protein
MVRAVQCITGASYDKCMSHGEDVTKEALGKGAGNMIFRELAPGSLAELERLVRLYKPAVLVVDQLRNIRIPGTKSDNFTTNLDKAAQGVRALAKRYGLVTICVTQAGDSAEGRPVLDMGDVDSSNTGIPGAADVMIGVGVTETLRGSGTRMLSLCKNKVSGTITAFTVRFDPTTSRYSSQ